MNSLERSVRKVEERDIPALAEIERLCFSEPWSEKSLALLCSDEYPSLVVTEGEEVCGYVGSLKALDELQITNVAISPHKRRRGLASLLLSEFDKMAKDLGIALISLEVRESNESALSLYKKFGYVTAGKRRGFYKDPREDAVIMIKNTDQTGNK